MKTQVTLVLLLASVLFTAVQGGLYGKKSAVVPLTMKNFALEVFLDDHVAVVEFYAPWCGHCKSLAPEYEKVAKNLKGIVKIGAVNCDEEKDLCGYFGIKGFPTLKIFPSEMSENPERPGQPWKTPSDYQGQRTAAAIVQGALAKMPNLVSNVNAGKLAGFLNEDGAKALLFSDKKKVANLYKALALDFKGRMTMGQAHSSDSSLVEEYGITDFPSLIVIKEDETFVTYSGAIKHDPLFEFLSEYAPPPKKKPTPKQPEEKKPVDTTVLEVTSSATFDECDALKRGICIIAFLDPLEGDRHTTWLDTLQKLSDKHGTAGYFKFLWVNGPEHYEFTDAVGGAANGFPSIVAYSSSKKVLVPFIGSFTNDGVSSFLSSLKRGKTTGAKKVAELPAFQ